MDARAPQQTDHPGPKAKGTTVLIAEDDPAIRRVYADGIRDAGFNVIETADGQEALELSLREHPDCLLLDINMPKLDGLEMLRRLRQDPWGHDAYALLLTNLSDFTTMAKGIEQDAAEYLVKATTSVEDVVKKLQDRFHH